MSRVCTICVSPQANAIARAVADGTSDEQISLRFGLGESSVLRHRIEHLKAPRRPKDREKAASSKGSVKAGNSRRFDSRPAAAPPERCPTCGILKDDPSDEMLRRRSEAAAWEMERFVRVAVDAGDIRLGLACMDRFTRQMDQVLKIRGLIGGDSMTVSFQQAEAMTLKKALEFIRNAIRGEAQQKEFTRICAAFVVGEPYELPLTIEQPAALNPAS